MLFPSPPTNLSELYQESQQWAAEMMTQLPSSAVSL